MPNRKARGNEHIISNLPKIARGLPHPGRNTIKQIIVAPAMPRIVADIFPKRISGSS
jgi:hypothetical protein